MNDLSRVEQLLRNALGEDIYEVTPQSRVEVLLAQLNELIEGIPKGEKGDRGEQGIQGIQGERGLTGSSGVYIGDTEPTDEGINVWIDTSEDVDDKSSPIVGIGRVGYMVVTSDTSADKSSPIVGVGQADYMKI